MSFDIYIGEAILDVPSSRELKEDRGANALDVRVEKIEIKDAPDFPGDSFTGKSNGRHPGYSQWDGSCKAIGLHDLFFDKDDGLMRNHPGTVILTKSNLETIRTARKAYEKTVRGKEPGWCLCEECAERDHHRKEHDTHRELDGNLARLLWLEWWVEWALKNCKVPALHNH